MNPEIRFDHDLAARGMGLINGRETPNELDVELAGIFMQVITRLYPEYVKPEGAEN